MLVRDYGVCQAQAYLDIRNGKYVLPMFSPQTVSKDVGWMGNWPFKASETKKQDLKKSEGKALDFIGQNMVSKSMKVQKHW
jgi:hypothetical protein